MAAQNHVSIASDGKGSGNLHRIAKAILDFKGHGVSTRTNRNRRSSSEILTRSTYIRKFDTVENNLSTGIIKLHVVRDNCGEGNSITRDNCIIIKRDRFILRGITDIGDGRKNSVINRRAIVESYIINIEGVYRRLHGLNISTNKRRRTIVICRCSGIHCGNIRICRNINRCIYPTRFGNVRLCTRVKVLHCTTNRGKRIVGLCTATSARCCTNIKLRLERKTCSTLGDVEPHTESSCVLTILNVAKNNAFTNVKQYIVRPTCEIRIGVIYVPSKRILTVSNNFGRNKGIAVNISGELTCKRICSNKRIGYSVIDRPLLCFIKTNEACI